MDELLEQYYESWLGLDAVYEKWAARRGVTFNMLNILTLLDDEGAPLAQAELCRRLHLSKQTVASVVDSLEKRGLAARSVSADDRRSRVVSLTGEGETFARGINGALRRFEIARLHGSPRRSARRSSIPRTSCGAAWRTRSSRSSRTTAQIEQPQTALWGRFLFTLRADCAILYTDYCAAAALRRC